MNIERLLDEKNFEKIEEFFSKNKNDTYFFSAENLDTIGRPDVEHLLFQNMLNKCICKDEFYLAENKVISLLEYLFAISKNLYCFSGVCEDSEVFKKHYYVKKSKDVKTFLDYVSNDIDKIIEVEDVNKLRGFAIIGIREIGAVCFYYKNPDALVVIDECKGIIYIADEKYQREFIGLANKLGLNAEKWNPV